MIKEYYENEFKKLPLNCQHFIECEIRRLDTKIALNEPYENRFVDMVIFNANKYDFSLDNYYELKRFMQNTFRFSDKLIYE